MKVVARNRKAQREYFIQDRFEAGIALKGTEIKSVRAGQLSLQEAYVAIEGGEAWLHGAHIAPYQQAGQQNHDPLRPRKLLLHKRELAKLRRATEQKGFTIIPLRVYLVRGLAKAEIALARGKRQYDKRQQLRKRDAQRQVDRALSRKR